MMPQINLKRPTTMKLDNVKQREFLVQQQITETPDQDYLDTYEQLDFDSESDDDLDFDESDSTGIVLHLPMHLQKNSFVSAPPTPRQSRTPKLYNFLIENL